VTSPITDTTGRGRGYTHPSNAGVDGCRKAPALVASAPPVTSSTARSPSACRPRDTCSSRPPAGPISSIVTLRRRDLLTLVVCAVLGALALGPAPHIPGLEVVDLGFASLGRLAGQVPAAAWGTPVLPALGGLVLAVAVPVALAVVLLRSPRERHGGALCLAWAATVLTALAADARSAAEPGPAAPGGPHDWAVLLGPRGLQALGRAADVAGALRGGAAVLLVLAVVVCATPLVAGLLRATARSEAPASTWGGPASRRV
jgi:hypothetical protein